MIRDAFWLLKSHLIVSPMMTLAFFVPFLLASDWSRTMSPMAAASFVLVWFAFGTISSGVFMLMEWGTSGRNYLIGSLAGTMFFIAAVTIITVLSGTHLTVGLANAVQGTYGWVWPVLALAISGALQAMLQRRLRDVISRRDFT